MRLHTHLKDYATLVESRCASFYRPKVLNGHNVHMYKAVQMTQIWVNMLMFGRSTINPLHTLKMKFGVNLGL